MKIENASNSSAPAHETNAQEKIAQIRAEQVRKNQKNAALNATPKKDSAAFSDQAKVIAKAYEELKKTPDIRADKIATLQKQIENGQYQINYQAIASKIGKVMGME